MTRDYARHHNRIWDDDQLFIRGSKTSSPKADTLDASAYDVYTSTHSDFFPYTDGVRYEEIDARHKVLGHILKRQGDREA